MTEMERLALGEAEISGFHDHHSESYKPPLLNLMQQTQADEKLRLFSIPCVPTIISLFLITNMPHNFILSLLVVYNYMDDFERLKKQFTVIVIP